VSPKGPSRRPTLRRWIFPLVLGGLGVALIASGEVLISDETHTYEQSLTHDCTVTGCATLGPLNEQPVYLAGEGAVAAGVIVLAGALLAALWSRPKPVPTSA
jgi:drug/metabolite transporter (DMT)-like permease